MRVALSLVGHVPYFWGGKSAAGWNDEWNTPRLVTSAGSGSTGTIRPYGLDCSGYTDWVYKTALGVGLPAGSSNQWAGSFGITEAELLPGDLGFMDRPGAVAVNHVLLYAGTDAGGKKLWVHCSSGAGGVAINSPSYVKYYRRPIGVSLETVTVPNA
jgi:cell wall-associated NlpC family hydrolase